MEDVNLILMMQALPSWVVPDNIKSMNMFNFSIMQSSLTALRLSEQVKSFEYYDNLNKNRVQNIRESILEQKDDLRAVETIMEEVHKLCQKSMVIHTKFVKQWQEKLKTREEKQKGKKH